LTARAGRGIGGYLRPRTKSPVTLRTVPPMNTHETQTHVHDDDDDDDAGETTT
jgi:hypothetical protein